MKLVVPRYVNNDGNPIFSCDIHPDGLRIATGGQGKDSGCVAIWNFNAIVDPRAEKDENIPKLLCQLDNHLSCVNCVRWSHSGTFLASGSDDKVIMIWRMVGETTINSSNVISEMERWRCVGTLTGHMNDVLDLAWAPHDSWLASCSVDNTVIVWNMDKIPEIVTRLTGHGSLVKGVTWDPVGQYLASQSDDKTLRIWRVSDWGEQVCITEPFNECGNITHVLRLHWSPDGQSLVSAHAMNNGGPTAKIIEIIERPITSEKYSWSCEMDFVGHRKAVTCIRFNNNLLQKKNEKKFCVLATGSRDCSIAVWSTNRRRPVIVIKNVFTKAVLDLSWSKDGMRLLACSWDGSIAIMIFTEEELGSVLSEDEKTLALEAKYGKSFALKHMGKVKAIPVAEMPLDEVEKAEPMDVSPRADKLQSTVLEADKSLNESAILMNGNSKLSPEDDPTKKTDSVPMTVEPVEVSEPAKPVIVVKQIETRTADGKRRITPITLSRSPASNEKFESFSTSCDSKTKIVVETRGEGKQLDTVAPIHISTDNETVNVIAVKRKAQQPVATATAKAARSSLIPVNVPNLISAAPSPTQSFSKPMCISDNEHILESLPIFPSGVVPILGVTDSWITIENTKPKQCSFVRRQDRKAGIIDPKWNLAFGDQIIAVRSNASVTIVCCKDSLLYSIDTLNGFYLTPPIKLSGLPACVVLLEDRACAITTRGHLTLWNLTTGKVLLHDQTLKFLLTDEGRIESVASMKITDSGSPLVVLSNGCSYCLTNDWGWSVVSNVNSLVYRESLQNPLIRSVIMQQDNRLPLKTALRTAKSFMTKMRDLSTKTENSTDSVQVASSAFLIHQMSSALVIKSSAEYKYLLLALIRLYIDQDNLVQLRTLIMDLLEESNATPISNSIKLLDISKIPLLRECFDLLKKNASCERLYKDAFDIFERVFVRKSVDNNLVVSDGGERPASPFSVF